MIRFGGLLFLLLLFADCATARETATAPDESGRHDAAARPVLQAGALTSALQLDGRLDEPDWAAADSIPQLTEVKPRQGGTPAGRTVLKVLASREVLVFGVVVLYPDSVPVVSFKNERDASLWNEDHIKLVLDTFLDGRSGYVFAVNARGARYDALISSRVVDPHHGIYEKDDWDAIWDAAVVRGPHGWSAEIRIPIKSLIFKGGLDTWGFNLERRVQALQETDRWAAPERDYRLTQMSRAGLLTNLPSFDYGLGLSIRPSLVGSMGRPEPGADTHGEVEPSLDVTQRIGPNLIGSLTIHTDFAEAEVDRQRTNLTRFPLFFPEKRSFFLAGADIFDFGQGLGRDVIPFFSRRIGLFRGRVVPIQAGLKVNGRIGDTNLGVLAVQTDQVAGSELPGEPLVPNTTMGVVRVKQNVLRESSVGFIGSYGDPQGRNGSWLAGLDFTYETSRLFGDKNFLAGIWGLGMGREELDGDRSAVGFKIEYPNDTWAMAFTYKRIGDAFDPSLGFVPRPGVQIANPQIAYTTYPDSAWLREVSFESDLTYVTDLGGAWESYELSLVPANLRLESGDRIVLRVEPAGERLREPFEIVEGVTIVPGNYHWIPLELAGEFASKRKLSGRLSYRFGGFFDGTLDQIEGRATWKPTGLITLELSGGRNIAHLDAGDFTADLVGLELNLNISPDLQFSSFVQYDTEGHSIGSNTRLRWTFSPPGDLFLVYNHNLRELFDPLGRSNGFGFDSNQLLLKVQYTFRY